MRGLSRITRFFDRVKDIGGIVLHPIKTIKERKNSGLKGETIYIPIPCNNLSVYGYTSSTFREHSKINANSSQCCDNSSDNDGLYCNLSENYEIHDVIHSKISLKSSDNTSYCGENYHEYQTIDIFKREEAKNTTKTTFVDGARILTYSFPNSSSCCSSLTSVSSLGSFSSSDSLSLSRDSINY